MSFQERQDELDDLLKAEQRDRHIDLLCNKALSGDGLFLDCLSRIKNNHDTKAVISACNFLLEKVKEPDKVRAVVNVSLEMTIGYKGELLLHPVVSIILAHPLLLPIVVNVMLYEDVSDSVLVEFLLSNTADDLIPGALLTLARRCIVTARPEHANRLIDCLCANMDSTSALVLNGLAIGSDRILAVLNTLVGSKLSVIPILRNYRVELPVSDGLFSVILGVGQQGSVGDFEILLDRLPKILRKRETVAVRLAAVLLECRMMGDKGSSRSESLMNGKLPEGLATLPNNIPGYLRIPLSMYRCFADADPKWGLAECVGLVRKDSSLADPLAVWLLMCIRDAPKNAKTIIIHGFGPLCDISQRVSKLCITALWKFNYSRVIMGEVLMTLSLHSRKLPVISFILDQLESTLNDHADYNLFLAVAVNLLTETEVRQKTLEYIAYRIYHFSFDLHDHVSIGLALKCLKQLVCLRYISPVAVWNEIILVNNWQEIEAVKVRIGCIQFAETSRLLKIQPAADKPALLDCNKEIAEIIEWVVSCLNQSDALVICNALSTLAMLDFGLVDAIFTKQGITLANIVETLIQSKGPVDPDLVAPFMVRSLCHEIQEMPRQLLIGVVEQPKGQSSALYRSLPGGLFSTLAANEDVFSDASILSSIASLPWHLKMQVIPSLMKYYKRYVRIHGLSISDVVNNVDAVLAINTLTMDERMIFWGLSVASLALLSPKEVSVDIERIDKLYKPTAREDVQFALLAAKVALKTTSLINIDSMAAALSAAGTMNAGQIRELLRGRRPEKHHLPLYCASTELSTAFEDSEYIGFLVTLMHAKDDIQERLKRVPAMLMKEPLDLQGTLSYFAAKAAAKYGCTEYISKVVRQFNELDKLPIVRQTSAFAAILPLPLDAIRDSVDVNKIITWSGNRKLFPYCDHLISTLMNSSVVSTEDHPDDVEPGLERFNVNSPFRITVQTTVKDGSDRLAPAMIKALADCPRLPRLDWYDVLKDCVSLKETVSLLANHTIVKETRSLYVSPSLVKLIVCLFTFENEAVVEQLDALLRPLSAGQVDECLDRLISRPNLSVKDSVFIVNTDFIQSSHFDRLFSRLVSMKDCKLEHILLFIDTMKQRHLTVHSAKVKSVVDCIEAWRAGPVEFTFLANSYDVTSLLSRDMLKEMHVLSSFDPSTYDDIINPTLRSIFSSK